MAASAQIVPLGVIGTAFAKAAGTVLAPDADAGDVLPGTALVLILVCDNPASTTRPSFTPDDSGGAAWTSAFTAVGSGVTTTAGAGIWLSVHYILSTQELIPSATRVTTMTIGASVVARACLILGYTGVGSFIGASTGQSTAGVPSTITSVTFRPGDLLVGCAGFEGITYTADADTLNGAWGAVYSRATSGSTAATNVLAGGQEKIVTAVGNQTFNPTGASADSIASTLTFRPGPGIQPVRQPDRRAYFRAGNW